MGKKRIFSDLARQRMSDNHADVRGYHNPMYGLRHASSTKAKMFLSKQACSFMYWIYRRNGGKKLWRQFTHAIKIGDITFELRPISVYI